MNQDKEFNELPVTTDIPMLRDQTIYKLYILKKGENYSNEDIRVAAKICNVNYIKAKKMLGKTRTLLAEEGAYKMQELLLKITAYEVTYEIEPPFPY